jgi:putative adenylate-forming enzyme
MFKLQILLELIKASFRPRFKNREELQAFQQKKIKKHIRWVKAHSEFYKNRAENNLQDFPLMNKEQMMLHFDELNTEGVKKADAFRIANHAEESRDFSESLKKGLTVGLSSGTSGNKGIFLATQSERAQWVAEVLRRVLPIKLLQKQHIAFFLRSNSTLYESIKSSVFAFHYFDLKRTITDLYQDLVKLNPSILIAPPSVLLALSELKEKNQQEFNFSKIISVAEVLESDVKITLEQRFGMQISQVYQATEGFLGSSCSEGILHLHEDLIHVECKFLNEAKTKFHPIISDFNRKTQPMLRYELNDILHLKKEPCKCGSVLMAIDHIEGRSDDVLEFGKQKIFPDFFRHAIILASDSIQNFRLSQINNSKILVELALDSVSSKLEIEEKVKIRLDKLFADYQLESIEIEFSELELTSFHDKFRRIVKKKI